MKRIFYLLALLLTSTTAWAEVRYDYDVENQILTIWGDGEIDDVIYFLGPADPQELQHVIINDGITGIGDGVFSNCRNLSSVTIGNSVTSIGDNAFAHCSSLTSVIIPNSVTSIGAYAFANCTGLSSVIIGSGVRTIGDLAFGRCAEDCTAYVLPSSPPTLGVNAVGGIQQFYVHGSEYSSAEGWSELGIEADDELYAVTIGEGITASGSPVVSEGNTKYYTLDVGELTLSGGTYYIVFNDEDGSDVTADLLDGSTLYLPAYDITVVKSDYNPADFAVNADGTAYTIKTAAGWGYFCDALETNDAGYFTGKTVTLDDDITVSRCAGSGSGQDLTESDRPFTGWFNGGGHTLTFNYGTALDPSDEDYIAPFRYVSGDALSGGVGISGLHVSGDIYTSHVHAGGLVGLVYGVLEVSNCRSSVNIVSSINGEGAHGGFIASTWSSSIAAIVGCTFDGSLQSASGYETNKCGGFVGLGNGDILIVNYSLFAPTALTVTRGSGSYPSGTFVRRGGNTNFNNSYYTRALGTAQGMQAFRIEKGDGVTDLAFSGSGTNFAVSGIKVYSRCIEYTDVSGVTTYFGGSEETVDLSLSHETRDGYTFSHYAASQGTLASETSDAPSLTLPDANQTPNDVVTITAQYDAIPTHSATFATGSGGEGWTIEGSAGGATPYEGKTVTVGYSGPHKVKRVTVALNRNTLSGLKALIDVADERALADLKSEYVGKYITSTGAIQAGSEGAVGIIAYISKTAVDNSFADSRVLVLATADASSSAKWSSQTDATCLATQYSVLNDAKNDMAGYANSNALDGNSSHTHAAATAAKNFATTRPTGASTWFLPSAGQWDKMITAAGGYASLRTNASLTSERYWSSTEMTQYYAWRYHFGDGAWDYANKTFGFYVRSAFAF